jgi:hypothetical protein
MTCIYIHRINTDDRSYIRRPMTGVYNSAEKNIKLSLNSLYGKMAQKIGGSDGKPPGTANPWYAAAITSWCRRRLLEACLANPQANRDDGNGWHSFA